MKQADTVRMSLKPFCQGTGGEDRAQGKAGRIPSLSPFLHFCLWLKDPP